MRQKAVQAAATSVENAKVKARALFQSFVTFITVIYYVSPGTWMIAPRASITSLTPTSVDWPRYAYVQYVTSTAYLCNSMKLFEILHRLGSRADRVMVYPGYLSTAEESSTLESRLLTVMDGA